MVSKATILEFKNIIESNFGVVLDEKEAEEIILNWMNYFDLLAKINHRKEIKVS